MITSGVTRDIDIPDEPGIVVTIRMLSHGALKKARNNRMMELAGLVASVDLSKFQRPDKDEEEDPDPLAGYDTTTVLHKGIKSWTYDEKCNPENIDELDDETSLFIALEIMKLSQRDAIVGEASSETSPVGS